MTPEQTSRAAHTTRRRYADRMSREDRRQQLLDAALRLINRSGYDAVTAAAIAREAGVSRPVIYHAFGSLDNLMYTLLQRQGTRVFTQIVANMSLGDRSRDPLDIWRENLRSFLEAVAEEPETWRQVLMPSANTPPVLRRRMETARDQIVASLSQAIAWGLRELGLPPDADVELFALLSIELFENAGRLVLRDPERFNPERLIAFQQSFVSLLSRPPRKSDDGA